MQRTDTSFCLWTRYSLSFNKDILNLNVEFIDSYHVNKLVNISIISFMWRPSSNKSNCGRLKRLPRSLEYHVKFNNLTLS